MPDKIVNHFVLADGSTAKYNAGSLVNLDDTVSLAGYAPDAKAVKEQIEAVHKILKSENITFTAGAYIATGKSPTTVLDLTPVTNDNYKYAIIPCEYGDQFILTGRGGGTPRLWAFINGNNQLISVSNASVAEENLILTAPVDATNLVANVSSNASSNCVKIPNVESKNLITENSIEINMSKAITTNGSTVPHSIENGDLIFTKSAAFWYCSVVVPVSYGSKFTLTGTGAGSQRLWAFVDKDARVLSVSGANATATELELVAPKKAVYLILNLNISTTFEVAVSKNPFFISQTESGNVAFKDGYLATPSPNTAFNFTPVSNDAFTYAIVECVKGEIFNITGFTDGNSARALYAFVDFNGHVRVRYLDNQQLVSENITAPLNGYFIVNCYKGKAHQITQNYSYALNAPITNLPPCFLGSMAYKPFHSLSKGYICMMTDDGNSGLVSDTIPLAISKNVPFTFAIMKESAVCQDETMLNTLIDAVNNHGCAIAQHSAETWDNKGEDWLNKFFDSEKEFFDSVGLSPKGAVIPGHYTTELVKAVCGGRFGVVRSGYGGIDHATGNQSNTVDRFYSYYTSGNGSNLYCLSSYNSATAEDTYNTSAVDYAYDNNKILICYFHENAMDSEKWQKVSNMIDYAITKGLEFITLGDIPYLLD